MMRAGLHALAHIYISDSISSSNLSLRVCLILLVGLILLVLVALRILRKYAPVPLRGIEINVYTRDDLEKPPRVFFTPRYFLTTYLPGNSVLPVI